MIAFIPYTTHMWEVAKKKKCLKDKAIVEENESQNEVLRATDPLRPETGQIGTAVSCKTEEFGSRDQTYTTLDLTGGHCGNQ